MDIIRNLFLWSIPEALLERSYNKKPCKIYTNMATKNEIKHTQNIAEHQKIGQRRDKAANCWTTQEFFAKISKTELSFIDYFE